MNRRNKIKFVGDFETTVSSNPIAQNQTEVWASGLVEIGTEDCRIFNCIEKTYDFLLQNLYYQDVIVYYHNLKFDGAFWLDYIMQKLHFKLAVNTFYLNGKLNYKMMDRSDMKDNTFITQISQMGQWYSIIIKIRGHYLELRDSMKLIPVSVDRMGKSFKTKHKKLDMEYISDNRFAGGEITKEERKYLCNDLLVVKEVLEIMFDEGHDRLTIGSCCLREFKELLGSIEEYNEMFPDLSLQECKIEGFTEWDTYIRNAYKGGWCYLKEEYAGKILGVGITADVNSLYPSVMHSISGNYYPVGLPTPFKGKIPEIAKRKDKYYFVRFKCTFELKKNKLPTVQIKNNWNYSSKEWLKTSKIKGEDGNYYDEYTDLDGKTQKAIVTLTMTCTDWELFNEHYIIDNLEILDGCWFNAELGIFDKYIDKYRQIKENSHGAIREIAKLYLNNLYGKLAASNDSSFKYPYIDDKRTVNYNIQPEHDKEAGYIAAGAAVTSYARNFTIRHAQKNYRIFIYADTDSIHCKGSYKQLKGINVHPTNFLCWKLEATWDKAIFVRQKTYIEHVFEENLQPIDNLYYNIKCAGMPPRCKELFDCALRFGQNYYQIEKQLKKLTTQEKIFFEKKKYTLKDFNLGLLIPSKLLPRRVRGGIVLTPTTYQMR